MRNHHVKLNSLATANPSWYVPQKEAYEHYNTMFKLADEERDLYKRLLLDSSIDGRYIGMDNIEQVTETNPDELNKRYLKYGRQICEKAIRLALDKAKLKPDEVGGLVVNSCTGYLCPGLSSYILEDVGLPTDIQYMDLMGMGCGGAIPNLFAASGIVASNPEKPVLSVAFEICTSTIFMGEDPGLIVSNCIFGDGASAAVLVSDNKTDKNPEDITLLDYESGLFPRYRKDLQYRTEDHRLRNVLGTRVPVIGAKTIKEVANRLLKRNGLVKEQIRSWAVHPGGTSVLDGVSRALKLQQDELRHSYQVFKQYGNMSSPSVMFVLKQILEHDRPNPGEYGLLLAFGAGFSAFAILVRF
ncbi:type III polyketide synthase [bacterium]|nr:type III polyketide synthase [bacterium]